MIFKSGVDEIRMDDIALEMSISKRTLYEMFGSKEDLLLECLDYHTSSQSDLFEKAIAAGSDVLSVTMNYIEKLYSNSGESVLSPVRNLEKYPKVKERLKQYRDGARDNMRCILRLGISQGVIRDDINIETILDSFAFMGQLCMREEHVGNNSLEDCVNSTFLVLLRGIATQEGLERIEKSVKEKQQYIR